MTPFAVKSWFPCIADHSKAPQTPDPAPGCLMCLAQLPPGKQPPFREVSVAQHPHPAEPECPLSAAALGGIQNSTQAPKCNSCRLLAPVLVRAAQESSACPAQPRQMLEVPTAPGEGSVRRRRVWRLVLPHCPGWAPFPQLLLPSWSRNQLGILSGRPSGPNFPGMMEAAEGKSQECL